MSEQTAAFMISALRTATDGLLYLSESDRPFEVVSLPGSGGRLMWADARMLMNLTEADPLDEMTAKEFLRPLTAGQSWHREADTVTLRRYRDLEGLLTSGLSDVRVFRGGKIQVVILIIGHTADGQWVGLKTISIET